MKKFKDLKFTTKRTIEAMVFLLVFFLAFGVLARRMGTPNMLNSMMKTAHDLLLNTCFYLMGITVLTGALGRLLTEFGVVRLLENILRPLMKPLFNLPGVAALGAVLTFLSDNPAIISLAHDKNFSSYFKKYQLISLTNFGTAFGMGLVVIAFMVGKGYGQGAVIGLLGAVVGCIVSTRLMQRAIIKAYPQYKDEEAAGGDKEKISFKSEGGVFIRGLNAILDGGKDGVQLGLAIIPGVIVISTVVMMITFGASASGSYTGAAYEGVPLLPWLAGKVNFLFEWLFGFQHPELIAFPITALGAVGAALGLVPTFIAEGFVDNNVIAVFTAMGMCWSGYLSTHSAMLDSLGYRNLVPKAIGAHTIGGLCAGVSAHLFYLLFSLVF